MAVMYAKYKTGMHVSLKQCKILSDVVAVDVVTVDHEWE